MSDNNKPTILIIEDDKTGREILKKTLSEMGYSCSEAENGKKGLELYLSYDFDLVLLDYVMPVMDGIECLKEIKSVDKKKKIPIIFLTASENKKGHEDFIELGADDILLKPYEEHLLKIKIQSWLRIKSTMDELSDKQHALYLRDLQHEDDLLISNKIIKKRTAFNFDKIKNIKQFEKSAEIMSGDIFLTEISPSGNQYLLLGDFTGHGLPAAIGSMLVSDLFYSMTMKGFSILEIANEINKKLQLVLPVNRFMAGCLIEINFEEDMLSIIQAGLPDVILYDNESQEIERLQSEYIPLGIRSTDDLNLSLKTIHLNKNSKLFLYTDGLIEAVNKDGEVFGKERLDNVIKKSSYGFTAYEKITNSYRKFMGDHKNFDDITFVEVLNDPSLINKNNESRSSDKKRTTSEWNMQLSIDFNIMKEIDPVPSIVNQLIELQGIQVCREKLYLILTELYSNALEHGILDLSSDIKNDHEGFVKYYELREQKLQNLHSGIIDFIFVHKPTAEGGVLNIKIQNSGDGFDYTKINYYLENNMDYKGRGVGLIQSLSDKFYYSENGCSANVELGWKEAA